MTTINLTIPDENGDEETLTLPARWEICDACHGDGCTTRHIEPDSGFTSSEWAEACDGDPDFAEDYFRGFYDRTCEDCNGTGKVLCVDFEKLDEVTANRMHDYYRDEARYDAERAAERRMGC